MLRGCRAKVPEVSSTNRLPCATMKYTYVDEIPVPGNRDKIVDLSNLETSQSSYAAEFKIISPLCLAAVRTAPKTHLTDSTCGKARSTKSTADEQLLLSPPNPLDDGSTYGKACTTNTASVFCNGDEVDF